MHIDKHIKPREMRIDSQAKSLHYFNMYAAQDRIDTSKFSDEASLPSISDISVKSVLPTGVAKAAMRVNFAILFGRVLKKYMPYFAKFGSGLEEHIVHSNYKEMSSKSVVVRLIISCLINVLIPRKYVYL